MREKESLVLVSFYIILYNNGRTDVSRYYLCGPWNVPVCAREPIWTVGPEKW